MDEEVPEKNNLPSKSQLKRDAHAITKLAEEILQLDSHLLQKLELPDNILDAVHTAKKIRQHGAKKRQLQYISKLLRVIDTDEISSVIMSVNNQKNHDAQKFHQLEHWREALIASDESLTQLLNENPTLDRQHLRNLIRNARKEKLENKAPTSYKELFRYLRSHFETDNP